MFISWSRFQTNECKGIASDNIEDVQNADKFLLLLFTAWWSLKESMSLHLYCKMVAFLDLCLISIMALLY